MGITNSHHESTKPSTAKLILHDGDIMEFTSPVKANHVLHKINNNNNNPTCFICNSDDMDFDGVITAVKSEEELEIGQIYFALPLTMLRRCLKAEEMAALAVKASYALTRSGGGGDGGRRKCVSPVVFYDRRVAAVGNDGENDGGRRRRRKFEAKLSKIEE
ncbi:unnamed protein product [Cochlearia groenlandica]